MGQLPWDMLQDEIGVLPTDFIAIFGKVLAKSVQDQIRTYPAETKQQIGEVLPELGKDPIRDVSPCVSGGQVADEHAGPAP